jgi:hypothetical protein
VTDLKKPAEPTTSPKHPWHSCFYCANLLMGMCLVFDDETPPKKFQIEHNTCEHWDEALPWVP